MLLKGRKTFWRICCWSCSRAFSFWYSYCQFFQEPARKERSNRGEDPDPDLSALNIAWLMLFSWLVHAVLIVQGPTPTPKEGVTSGLATGSAPLPPAPAETPPTMEPPSLDVKRIIAEVRPDKCLTWVSSWTCWCLVFLMLCFMEAGKASWYLWQVRPSVTWMDIHVN